MTDEHRVGSMLIALASVSAGNYVLIRTGRHRRAPHEMQWRISFRLSAFDPYQTVAAAPTLIEALERALLRAGLDVPGSSRAKLPKPHCAIEGCYGPDSIYHNPGAGGPPFSA